MQSCQAHRFAVGSENFIRTQLGKFDANEPGHSSFYAQAWQDGSRS